MTEALRQTAPIPGHTTTLASMPRHAGGTTAELASLSRRSRGIWETASTPHPLTDKTRGHHVFQAGDRWKAPPKPQVGSKTYGRSAFFVEVVLIDFEDLIGLLDPCADSMAQHQVDQLLPIHQDDLRR